MTTPPPPQRRRRRVRRDRGQAGGQVVITFALTLVLFLFGLIASVVDLSVLYTAKAVALQASQDGAVAGASNVNVAYFLQNNGAVKLESSATQACNSVARQEAGSFTYTNAHPPGGTPPLSQCYSQGTPPAGALGCPSLALPNYEIGAPVVLPIKLPIGYLGSTTLVSACYVAAAQAGTNTASGN